MGKGGKGERGKRGKGEKGKGGWGEGRGARGMVVRTKGRKHNFVEWGGQKGKEGKGVGVTGVREGKGQVGGKERGSRVRGLLVLWENELI